MRVHLRISTGGVMRWFLPRALLRRCRGLRRAPVLRRHFASQLCACDGPLFVRSSENDVYQCRLCGGRQEVNEWGSSASVFSTAQRSSVSVAPGVGYVEGVRRIRSEISSHVVAARTSYPDLAAKLAVAQEESSRNLQTYTDWCAHVNAHRALLSREVSLPRGGSSWRGEVSLDVLQRALYALRFAVAVYALPYELGYFDNVCRSLQLWTLRRWRYVQATTEEQVSAIRRILSGKRHDPLLEVAHARYSSSLGEPCFAVFLDHRMRRVVIAFRGTLSPADLIADLASGYTTVHLGTCCNAKTGETERVSTHVPRGFYTNVMEAGTHLLPALDIIRQQHPDYAFMCVGHSLGAVEAILFHLLFFFPNQQDVNMRTIAFAPAPCIDHAVVPKLNKLLGEEAITSWVYGLDAVARLQVRSVVSLFYPSFFAGLSDTEHLPLLSIPGRLLHMMPDNMDVMNVPIDAPWRHQIILKKEGLLHHIPMTYTESLYKFFWHMRAQNVGD